MVLFIYGGLGIEKCLLKLVIPITMQYHVSQEIFCCLQKTLLTGEVKSNRLTGNLVLPVKTAGDVAGIPGR
jgi:hypothetical protein